MGNAGDGKHSSRVHVMAAIPAAIHPTDAERADTAGRRPTGTGAFSEQSGDALLGQGPAVSGGGADGGATGSAWWTPVMGAGLVLR